MIKPGTIFGWKIFGDNNVSLYHTGVVIELADNPYDHLVIHYGCNCKSEIYIETLYEAALRTESNTIHFNTTYTIPEHKLDLINDEDHVDRIQHKYREYDITCRNCQTFICDMFEQKYTTQVCMLEPICSDIANNILSVGLGFSKKDTFISKIWESIKKCTDAEICCWNRSLDLIFE